uniref:Uncharacterized protein n=1 Tax=Anguilla anguilla TaxID=7936 RepID=A0A0E9W297_ANGAN
MKKKVKTHFFRPLEFVYFNSNRQGFAIGNRNPCHFAGRKQYIYTYSIHSVPAKTKRTRSGMNQQLHCKN